MTYFLMAAMYLGLLVVHVRQIIRSNLNKPDFRLGILVGNLFFVVIPLGIGLLNDKIPSPFPVIPDFYPSENISTLIVIFIGWISVLAFGFFGSRRLSSEINITRRYRIGYKAYTKMIFFFYIALGVVAFEMSGLGEEGSHWYRSAHELLESSASYVLIKNFSGVYRVFLFGLIYGLFVRGIISDKYAVIWGILIVIIDMSISFNRITIVFLAFISVLIYRKYILIQIIGVSLLIPLVSSYSQVWPEFRSTVFEYGFSIENTFHAWNRAVETVSHMPKNEGAAVESIFESSNIAVLNFIVENSGSVMPYSYGSTFIVRPLITFLPKALFPWKPEAFNSQVGYAASGLPGKALNSVLFGEAFNNFPILWPIFFSLFLLIYSRIFRWCSKFVPLVDEACFMGGVAVWRFDTNFLSVCFYALLLAALLVFALSQFRLMLYK